ncbi:hypothetical protein Pan216_53480 [Planctomycetes bacterium Pan216]|uniref:Uncharacterized protein n=1 Tax=Kolteria novifilia TaxID=2527975 RepID=A0A518BBU2_9BACT|nr:hypothetical protein Pan216_53480 [Planctomycetes bacterium Pan216]
MGRRWAGILLFLLAGCASVRSVVPENVYRAGGVMPEARLDQEIAQRDIQTVVNVSGFQPGESWYRHLREHCETEGVELVDLTIEPNVAPDREELLRLVETYKSSPKPILLVAHDSPTSAGFAGAFYLLSMEGQTPSTAIKQLPPWARVGHDPLANFVTGWTSLADFYRDYGVTPETAHDHAVDASPALAQSFDHQVARPTEPTVKPSAKTELNREEVTESLYETAERIKQTWDEASDGPSYALFGNHLPEEGTVLRDYSSVIVNSPIDQGTILIGRAKPLLTWGRPKKAPPPDDGGGSSPNAPIRLGAPVVKSPSRGTTTGRGLGVPIGLDSARGRSTASSTPPARLGAPVVVAARDLAGS